MFSIAGRRISRPTVLVIVSACVMLTLVTISVIRGRAMAVISGRPDRPCVWVVPPRHDFGKVKPLETVEATFTVENRGTQVLSLEPPTASCGCQKPTIDKLTLGPGESATLRVRQQARESVGGYQQMVFLKTNDPSASEVMIPLSVVVNKGVVVRPDPLYLSMVTPEELRTRTIEVVSDDGQPFSITICATGSDRLDAEAVLNVPNTLHRVTVTLRGDRKLGPFEERLVITVDRPETAPLMIPVRGEVLGPIKVTPSALSLGNVSGFSESEASLIVSSMSGVVRVDGLTIFPDGWQVRYDSKPLSEGRRHLLRLKVRVPNATGVIEAQLNVRVSGGGSEPKTIAVPITASVRASSTGEMSAAH